MPRYRIEVNLAKGGSIKTIHAALRQPGVLPADANVSVTKDDPPSSRADRLAAAMSLVDDAKSEIVDLKDELQSWADGLPENLQSGSKADEINDAVQELENLESSLDDAISSADGVSFPGMY